MKNVDPLQRQKRKKNKQKREREGGGKKGENKIKLESVEERRARFNPIQTRLFLGSKNQGGAHCATLAKTLLPFSESIQVNFF